MQERVILGGRKWRKANVRLSKQQVALQRESSVATREPCLSERRSADPLSCCLPDCFSPVRLVWCMHCVPRVREHPWSRERERALCISTTAGVGQRECVVPHLFAIERLLPSTSSSAAPADTRVSLSPLHLTSSCIINDPEFFRLQLSDASVSMPPLASLLL